MSSRFDGLVLPTIPLTMKDDPFILDMHVFLQNLVRTLKTIPDAEFPIYHKVFGLADDATWDNVRNGIYVITADSGAGYAVAHCKYNSAVTLLHNSANWVNTDTDTKYCLIDNTTSIRLKNRLGSAKEFAVMIITID
uniref:Uncharacterized protein n=1 Tax=viral metagenome TaxID=1070528 RepID=A0A6H1ZBC2_9ZZZZ